MVSLRNLWLGPLLLCSYFLTTVGVAAEAELASDSRESTAGYYQLRWQSDRPVRLTEARTADFSDGRVIYAGPDTARVMSGKPDGTWYYRLESSATGEPVTDIITVTVRHHSLARAWTFFSLGAVVFIATLSLIFFGQRAVESRTGNAGH